MTNTENRIIALFDDLVPPVGKADTVAGEIIRAISRIGYRLSNDGDHIGLDYGNETCNPAARYLQMVCDEQIQVTIDLMWGLYHEGKYEGLLNDLMEEVLDYLDEHPELMHQRNDIDMLDLLQPEDLYQEAWDEDEEDEWAEDWYEEE